MSSFVIFLLQRRPFHTPAAGPATHPNFNFQGNSRQFMGRSFGGFIFIGWNWASEKSYLEIANDTRIGLRIYNNTIIHITTSEILFFSNDALQKIYDFRIHSSVFVFFNSLLQCSAYYHQAVCFGGGRSTVNRTMVNDAMSGDATLPGAVTSESPVVRVCLLCQLMTSTMVSWLSQWPTFKLLFHGLLAE